jgi:hypothetical protein
VPRLDAGDSLYELNLSGFTAFVFGNEGQVIGGVEQGGDLSSDLFDAGEGRVIECGQRWRCVCLGGLGSEGGTLLGNWCKKYQASYRVNLHCV